ncbi:MAG: hypothetical protein ACI92S_000769 [Planctomycetaceae bacterium]|jgi:hypothetical protein
MCGPIGSIQYLRIGDTSFAPLRGKMVRANKSRFDAGDAAMLTFLLDKQDSLQRWQPDPSVSGAKSRISLQANRRCRAEHPALQTAIPSQSTYRDIELANSCLVSQFPSRKFGTTSARESQVRWSVFKERQFTDSRNIRTLRFAHCVRSRTTWSSLAHKPCRSHT